MVNGHFPLRPAIDTQGRRTFVGTAAEEGRDRDHVALAGAAARDALQLAELLERVNPDVRAGADARADPALADLLDGTEAVAEVRLCRRADADPRSALRHQVELVRVGVRGMHDRRVRAETAGLREELDRPHAVLLQAFLDLARLLVGVHVEREALRGGVAAKLLEPVSRAGTDGVGGEPDAHPGRPQLLEPGGG